VIFNPTSVTEGRIENKKNKRVCVNVTEGERLREVNHHGMVLKEYGIQTRDAD